MICEATTNSSSVSLFSQAPVNDTKSIGKAFPLLDEPKANGLNDDNAELEVTLPPVPDGEPLPPGPCTVVVTGSHFVVELLNVSSAPKWQHHQPTSRRPPRIAMCWRPCQPLLLLAGTTPRHDHRAWVGVFPFPSIRVGRRVSHAPMREKSIPFS